MKNQKGITLIALVITIIVMLILVTVSVTIILQNGIFKAAASATRTTEQYVQEENTLSSGIVNVQGVTNPINLQQFNANVF